MTEARIATRATGLLREFNDAGVLAPADVHVARRLAGLVAERDETVALAESMQRAHYPLQALLYLVALHRYLRWRLPGYARERHLGGVLYLFLRGMTGGPAADGVFAWSPPSGLVESLSDLLDGSGAR